MGFAIFLIGFGIGGAAGAAGCYNTFKDAIRRGIDSCGGCKCSMAAATGVRCYPQCSPNQDYNPVEHPETKLKGFLIPDEMP